jgi:hypothetical protein
MASGQPTTTLVIETSNHEGNPDDRRDPDRPRPGLTATSTLQKLLPELVALALDAKQAHWNITGPASLPLRTLTNEIAADARAWADRIAERAVALGFDLGFAVDARPGTVAAVAGLFPTGRVTDQGQLPS